MAADIHTGQHGHILTKSGQRGSISSFVGYINYKQIVNHVKSCIPIFITARINVNLEAIDGKG